MEWYQYALIAAGIIIALRWLAKRGKALARGRNEADDRPSMPRSIVFATPPQRSEPLKPELKRYVTRLCQVHAASRSFTSADATVIGKEINEKYGYNGMVEVCDELRTVLGAGPARELEYKWDGIGEWQG
jgi:hypothetical protein